MKKPLNKDIYKEMKIGKKELTIVSVIVMILSVALIVGGVVFTVLGATNQVEAWQIIWRVIVGVFMFFVGLILLGVGFTMLAVTRSMLNIDEGNVADGNRAVGTVNVQKCEKCGTKIDDNAKFCKNCGEQVDEQLCDVCGKQIDKDSKYCEECGKGVEKKSK